MLLRRRQSLATDPPLSSPIVESVVPHLKTLMLTYSITGKSMNGPHR